MALKPTLFTHGLSGLSQSQSASDANSPSVSSPAERGDAKRNMLKAMRLPTQHYWHVWFDRPPIPTDANPSSGIGDSTLPTASTAGPPAPNTALDSGSSPSSAPAYVSNLEQLGDRIESVSDFWKYHNSTPVDEMRMRESIYLFKSGFRPVWEDRRNVLGGSWTFRLPKVQGSDLWTRVQMLAIGEQLQVALDAVGDGDQLCGVGLSVRFNSHLVSIWNRDAFSQRSVDAIRDAVLADLPPHIRLRPVSYFYKAHADHPGFCPPAELLSVLESKRRAAVAAAAATTGAGSLP